MQTLLCSLFYSLDKGLLVGLLLEEGRAPEKTNKLHHMTFDSHSVKPVYRQTGSDLRRAYKGDSKETRAVRGGFGDSVGDTGSSESRLNQCSRMTLTHLNLGCVLD